MLIIQHNLQTSNTSSLHFHFHFKHFVSVSLQPLWLLPIADPMSQNSKMQFTLASVMVIAAALAPAVSAFSVTVSLSFKTSIAPLL